jgi:hypothetical protein
MVGAQASKEQHDKILSYVEIGKQEGAKKASTAPSMHLLTNSSSWSKTSSKKIFGDLPPSSTVEGIMFLWSGKLFRGTFLC